MLKKFMFGLLIAGVMIIVSSCGGSSGGSTPSTDGSLVTLTTNISMDQTRVGIKDAVNMTVTLTLADGTSVIMTKTGNGNEYSCAVAYQAGDPVYIKAVYGDAVLKQFMESVPLAGGAGAVEDVTPLSTLFVDVLESMTQAIDSTVTSGNVVSALLEGVKDATLAIDVTTVKSETTDTGNSVYTTLQQQYQAALTWDNVATQAVVSSTLQNTVQTVVEAGGVSIPVGSDEASAVAAVAKSVIEAVYSGNISVFAAMVGTGFLNSGYDATATIADMTSEYTMPAGYTMHMISDSATATAITESDPAYATVAGGSAYRIQTAYHAQVRDGSNNVVYEEAGDDLKSHDAGLVLKKSGSAWVVLGNQQMADYWFTITDDKNWDAATYGKYLYAQICQGSTALTSATVTSGSFSGTVTLVQNPYDTECYSAQIFEKGPVWAYSQAASQFQQMSTATMNSAANPFCGKTLTYHATFSGGATETRTVSMPDCVAQTATASAVKNANGSVTVSYTLPSDIDLSEIKIYVGRHQTSAQDSGYSNLLEKSNLPFASTSYTFDASNFTSGFTYTFRVMFRDLYNREYSPVQAYINF